MSGVLHPSDQPAAYEVPGRQGHCLACGCDVVPNQFFHNLQDLLQRHADAALGQQTTAPAETHLKRPPRSHAG